MLTSAWRMVRFHCDGSSSTCGHSLTNGVAASWPPAKLSHWGMEGFRRFDEPVGFQEKPLPKGYARSLRETLYRDGFAAGAQAGRTWSSAIASFWSRWSGW